MNRFQYKILTAGQAAKEENLNALGAIGYHFVGIQSAEHGGRFYFEREVDEYGMPIQD